MKRGFVRPIGSRTIEVTSCLSVLPWDVWRIISNEQALSRLGSNQFTISTKVGMPGKILEEELDYHFTWELETIESKEPTSLKLAVIGNPWHHRPDVVDSTIEFDIGETINLKLCGFDLSHIGDAQYIAASNWAWSSMSNLLSNLDGKISINLYGNRGFVVWTTISATPDQVRHMILTAEESVKWLADVVIIEPRLTGDFLLRWQRPWGEIFIHGTLTTFEPNQITLTARENPFANNIPFSIDFHFEQIEGFTKVIVKIDGFDIEPWATSLMFAISEFIQISLTSLSLLYSTKN